tara:strand:+ start:1170 stop:1364 length:195 start_codon:yes stop_codon:yes gene_type:complete
MKIAGVMGDFQSRAVLSLFYFIIVLPFGLVVRIFGDPLRIRKNRESSWTEFALKLSSVDQARKQ